MENSTFEIPDTRILEGSLLMLVCVSGLVSNLLSFLVLIRHRSFRNPFGYLAAYHAFSNAAILLIFIFWAVPWTLLSFPQQLQSLNLRIGQLSIFFYETAFHCCLFASINRLMAINFPMLYRRMFTDTTTISIVIFISVLSAIYTSVYFKAGCDFYFDHEHSVWSFGSEPCSLWMSFYIDMCYNAFLFLVIVVIDITTLVQLKSTTKLGSLENIVIVYQHSGIPLSCVPEETLRLKKLEARREVEDNYLSRLIESAIILSMQGMLSRSVQTDGKQSDISSERRRKELLLFTQTFANSLMYVFLLLCYHLIAPSVSTNFQLYLCTTLVWALSHTCGGIILIVFNPEIRRHIVNFRDISRSPRKQATTVITVKFSQPSPLSNQRMYQR